VVSYAWMDLLTGLPLPEPEPIYHTIMPSKHPQNDATSRPSQAEVVSPWSQPGCHTTLTENTARVS
jgi:hypothetical protein